MITIGYNPNDRVLGGTEDHLVTAGTVCQVFLKGRFSNIFETKHFTDYEFAHDVQKFKLDYDQSYIRMFHNPFRRNHYIASVSPIST
jgi:hypothetical protein